eukprot:CAMPEP_0184521872 /NCGR_PEP_ID=MMETSP0198_2-20121128/7949_1 /TAXON_ID=1112570 /ORGANISM="Thraustochytrium sp., Strain LLF1b" /LENGTH=144 /DNA_ID=CAMNT_0026912599 /DNA_START=632 /DNA_END=1063 /DNA_ORIENTATION=-
MVCLSGIMLDSGRFENRVDITPEQNFITYLLIFIVVGSILYYLLVFAAEVFPWLSTYMCTLLMRRKDEDHEVLDLNDGLNMIGNPMFDSDYNGGDDGSKEELGATLRELDRVTDQNKLLRQELASKKRKDQECNLDSSSAFAVR